MIVGSNPVAVLHCNYFSYVTSLSMSQCHFPLLIFVIFVSTNLQVVFKSQNNLCNNFCFKDPVPQILTSCVVTTFSLSYGINPIGKNVLGILLSELVNILVFHLELQPSNFAFFAAVNKMSR